ncbi:Ribosomal protein S18 acetylase RimI [Terribacillus aidingensis]|uniref:Ribosomal protein S18 acetylase RimI n=1 Tax=Terribacillus aidingensis TaxID=586416 RepID=A0A285NQG0_9BACI|nr:GNAT family N-acetyltransferase [Terribacillus aidingensis]SNZ11689.1 Ribosomal protein S18 acetylase RimI [Terribacillus aidingensis]
MNLRKPELSHAETIAAICSKGWRQTVAGKLSEDFQRQNVDYWYNLERVKEEIQSGSYRYVAMQAGRVVGVIGGVVTAQTTGEVFVLYVDESARYKGAGKLLLEALTKDQKQQGASEQWVSVQEGNLLGIPFYEARGFRLRGKKINLTETGETQVSLRYYREID